MSKLLYMQEVSCSGGCGASVVGCIRREDQEFTEEQNAAFDAALAHLRWARIDGFWHCPVDCVPFPDLSVFAKHGFPRHYKIRTINPDYYGTVEIKNDE